MKRFLFFIFALLSIVAYSQEKRLALIIGNSEYQHGAYLRNPVNDAVAMKGVLSQAGFDVLDHFDLNLVAMKKAIDDFGSILGSYDIGLFFYAGHGVQAKGDNYLIPVDASLKTENDVEYNCVNAGRVLAKMEDARNRTNIIILDACRDNPFERSWTRSMAGKGLASITAPVGSMICYATAPGHTASDGAGKNGLYTSALLQHITKPGLPIEEVFKRVRVMVREESDNTQIPWESTSLEGDFYFHRINEPDPIIRDSSSIITDNIEKDNTGLFVDTRDNQQYNWVEIGEQIWMVENLKFTSSGSWSNHIFGRLYNWRSANKACPDGWHLPSDEEWNTLEGNLGMKNSEILKFGYRGDSEGGRLKESSRAQWMTPNTGATNETGFSALPGGLYSSGIVIYTGERAYFWTSTKDSFSDYLSRSLDFDKATVYRGANPKKHGLSVRCVKDSP